MEDSPPQDLLASQHIVLATNCVNATHDLVRPTSNIHKMLRPDDLLMMLEMTLPLPWVDLVFGLVEGWWLFSDGRKHALAPPEVWQRTLHQDGYGAVDWTDGARPEAAIQRVIMAIASGPRYDPSLSPATCPSVSVEPTPADRARQGTVDSYVEQYTADFHILSAVDDEPALDTGIGVLVTGATGSLGSHVVAHLARLKEVSTVVCLNRPRGASPDARQKESFRTRGIRLASQALYKIRVFQADTSKPRLGLPPSEYQFLRRPVSHIVHNAWPMSISRAVEAFTAQFQTLRNLLDPASQVAARRNKQIGFQFISSIATVGQYSRRTGQTHVPETRMTAGSALCTGLQRGEACLYMLDKTLHAYPEQFWPMAVRIGQIAGSRDSGHWDPVEHLAFMLKSSQTLRYIVAGTLSDLLFNDAPPSPIYHIENPIRQPWKDMLQTFVKALDAPDIVPFEEWTQKVRGFRGTLEQNPAARLVDFLDEHFVAMSCGYLILDTSWARRHSRTLTGTKPVDEGLVRLYVRGWKQTGFLNQVRSVEPRRSFEQTRSYQISRAEQDQPVLVVGPGRKFAAYRLGSAKALV
ncbi:uncharacterized protein BDV17DRAFT_294223 [Aspergillus undulatus]|uniref:uncharacterized protein n=1 Tax=Aspergillus undulatus TaxID=1810928 RepID=UPI003CCDA47A